MSYIEKTPMTMKQLNGLLNYPELVQEKGSEDNSPSALDKQEGGNHYKKYKIQPVEYAMANNLNYCQANAVKYVTRYKDKNGVEDLLKAIHNLEILIELEEKGHL